MATLRAQPNRPDHFARSIEPKNYLGTIRAKLNDFHAAGCQKYDLLYRITFEIDYLVARVFLFARCRYDFSALRGGNIREQWKALN
jgi:hypothetical protein